MNTISATRRFSSTTSSIVDRRRSTTLLEVSTRFQLDRRRSVAQRSFSFHQLRSTWFDPTSLVGLRRNVDHLVEQRLRIAFRHFRFLLRESFRQLGYVEVTKLLEECPKSSSRIEWLSKGPQSLLFSSSQSFQRRPIVVSSIRRGRKELPFDSLPPDILRTSHNKGQVEVLLVDQSPLCERSCDDRFVVEQTPKIFLVDRNPN